MTVIAESTIFFVSVTRRLSTIKINNKKNIDMETY